MKNPIKLVALFVLACMLGAGIAAVLPTETHASDCDYSKPVWYCPYDEPPCENPPWLYHRLYYPGQDTKTGDPCGTPIDYGCAVACYQQ